MGTSSSDQRSNQLSRNESIKCILKGIIVALICTLALCILGGILQSFVELNSNFISNIIPIFGYISGGIGGIYAACKMWQKWISNRYFDWLNLLSDNNLNLFPYSWRTN